MPVLCSVPLLFFWWNQQLDDWWFMIQWNSFLFLESLWLWVVPGYLAFRFVSKRANLIAKALWRYQCNDIILIDEMWNRLRKWLSRVQDYRCHLSGQTDCKFQRQSFVVFGLNKSYVWISATSILTSLTWHLRLWILSPSLPWASSVVLCEMRPCRIVWVVCIFIVEIELEWYFGISFLVSEVLRLTGRCQKQLTNYLVVLIVSHQSCFRL